MKKIIIRVIMMIMVIGVFTTIFNFSNQSGNESKSVSRKVASFLIDLQPKYKEITKEEKFKLIESYQTFVRKGAHFSIYTLLGLSITTFLCTFDIENKKKITIALIIGMTYAISDEIHQIFIPERTALVIDVFIDTAGVIVGIGIIMGILEIIKK